MMRNLFKLLFSIFLTLVSLTVNALPTSGNDTQIVNDAAIQFMKENDIPGMAVLLYDDGKPYAYYFGYANRAKKTPITKNTIFEVGSLSKLMTSLLLAQQIDSAKMKLTDPLTKYLSELPSSFVDISLKDLATHTSGLPFDAPKNIHTRAELEKYLTTWSPDMEDRDQWVYSNFGMGMLGFALETATHKNFNQLYRSNILSPLNMQPIGLTVSNRLKRYLAQGYDQNGKPVNPTSLGLFPTAYGVKVSADDMQHFLRAAIGLPGTPEQIFYPMRMTQTAYIRLSDKMQGLGWEIHNVTPDNVTDLLNAPEMSLKPEPVVEVIDKPLYDGESLIDKTGTTDGFRAYIATIPNKKTGIVILANKNIAHGTLATIGRAILFKVNNIAPENNAAKNANDET